MRYFTVHEAEALIPDLEEVFKRAQALREQAEKKAESLRGLEERGEEAQAALLRGQVQFLVNGVNACLGEVAALGAVPKGIEPALVDFPHRMGGKEVYLCWRLGETSIAHYHGVEDGFAGRKALPS